MSAYLYLLFSKPGQLSGLTLEAGADDRCAGREAERLLHAHDDVRLVEVWRDARLVTQAPL